MTNDRMIDNAATASQNRTLLDDPVTREAIKLNVIAPYVEALTPSEQTKADYIGEFQFTATLTEIDESGEPYEAQRVMTVPWTTVKEIMAAIKARAER